MIEFTDDNPKFHYPENLINVEGKMVLDMGCGNLGQLDNLLYYSTSEHFINSKAKGVIGIDVDSNDINYLNGKNIINCTFINIGVESAEQIKSLIKEYNIDIIKSDCEGGEIYLLEFSDEEFKKIQEYYIETHTPDLYNRFLSKFEKCEYKIREILNFTPCGGEIKVIFAHK